MIAPANSRRQAADRRGDITSWCASSPSETLARKIRTPTWPRFARVQLFLHDRPYRFRSHARNREATDRRRRLYGPFLPYGLTPGWPGAVANGDSVGPPFFFLFLSDFGFFFSFGLRI